MKKFGMVNGKPSEDVLVILRRNWLVDDKKVWLRCPCCYKLYSWSKALDEHQYQIEAFRQHIINKGLSELRVTLPCGHLENAQIYLDKDG